MISIIYYYIEYLFLSEVEKEQYDINNVWYKPLIWGAFAWIIHKFVIMNYLTSETQNSLFIKKQEQVETRKQLSESPIKNNFKNIDHNIQTGITQKIQNT